MDGGNPQQLTVLVKKADGIMVRMSVAELKAMRVWNGSVWFGKLA